MISTGPRPQRSAADAVAMARTFVGRGTYNLTRPDPAHEVFDCFGFAVTQCYGIPRHRPGYNRGWIDVTPEGHIGPTVVDDMNSNSAIEDAMHAAELFILSPSPQVGDIIACPTIRLPGVHAGPWIGHAVIVTGVARVTRWDAFAPRFWELDIIECTGPDGHRPAIGSSNGRYFDTWSATWPSERYRSRLLRLVP